MTMADFSSIEIRIETIEVEGLSRAEAPGFRHEVEQELTRLIGDAGLPGAISGSRGLVSTTMPNQDAMTGDMSLSARVAAVIYGALTT